jgi:hypothetical protein
MPERRRFPDPLHPLKEVFKFAVRFVEANRMTVLNDEILEGNVTTTI